MYYRICPEFWTNPEILDTVGPLLPPIQKKKFCQRGKQIKVAPNWLKWRENWPEIIYGFYDPPPAGITFCFLEALPLQISRNGEKIGQNFCLTHPPPPTHTIVE